jgi:hypothetical protein
VRARARQHKSWAKRRGGALANAKARASSTTGAPPRRERGEQRHGSKAKPALLR